MEHSGALRARTVLDEFFRIAFRTIFYESIAQLQTDLDAWPEYYIRERPHQGYRNLGRRPVDLFLESLSEATLDAAETVRDEAQEYKWRESRTSEGPVE